MATDPLEVVLDLRRPGERSCALAVPDEQGSYTIPFIQSARHLAVGVIADDGRAESVSLRLVRAGRTVLEHEVLPGGTQLRLGPLDPGEYRLEAWCGSAVEERVALGPIGVGTVLAALGDSITEGYHGRGFRRDDLHLHAAAFPREAVSRDGRNFPQFSPTTARHRPEVNCFQSWMTALNDRLSEAWRQPVFIANEGWGGITTAAYLERARHDEGWRRRMRLLRPRLWLIHLGVNDERARVRPEVVAANLEALVDLLESDFGAEARCILVARPCCDYAEGAREILAAYCGKIDALVARRDLSPGPDFFAAYATERERWYGADPVHPNVEGMEYMAQLWLEALTAVLPEGPP